MRPAAAADAARSLLLGGECRASRARSGWLYCSSRLRVVWLVGRGRVAPAPLRSVLACLLGRVGFILLLSRHLVASSVGVGVGVGCGAV